VNPAGNSNDPIPSYIVNNPGSSKPKQKSGKMRSVCDQTLPPIRPLYVPGELLLVT
jgi:hypothetical protein